MQRKGRSLHRPEANTFWTCRETAVHRTTSTHAQVRELLAFALRHVHDAWRDSMAIACEITPAKRKRLFKTFGPCPAGYTNDDLERFLDLLYGMYSHVYSAAELRHMVVSDPFDRSETPRQLKLVELTDWLEALVI